MNASKVKTINDILHTPSLTSALECKSITSKLIKLYGDNSKYAEKKKVCIEELEILNAYIKAEYSRGKHGNSSCLC